MRALLAAFALSVLAACASPANAPCGGFSGAASVLHRVIAADNARDLRRVVNLYTDDVVWIPPAPRPRLEGIAAIGESYRVMYATFAPALTVTTDEAIASGADAIVRGRTGGRLHPIAGGGDTIVDDNYRATLRCDGERWRISELAWGAAAN